MRVAILTTFILVIMSSCDNRCYTCQREVACTSDAPFPGYPVTSVTEFKVTKEQAEAYNNLLIIKKDTVNGVVLTTNSKTVCGR
jgi:hypothetical protein